MELPKSAGDTCWSSDFVKEHPSLPQGLLKMPTPLPYETHGIGGFVEYDQWARVVCDTAIVPSRKTPGAAGHDLYSIEKKTIPAGGSNTFDTGVAVALPKQHYGKIEGRSSLGFNHCIVAFGGIVDEDYRGVIKVKLFNHGVDDYIVQKYDRIAQLIVQKYSVPSFRVVSAFPVLNAIGPSSTRGSAGFGSTGK